jgi:hypothetical protein
VRTAVDHLSVTTACAAHPGRGARGPRGRGAGGVGQHDRHPRLATGPKVGDLARSAQQAAPPKVTGQRGVQIWVPVGAGR